MTLLVSEIHWTRGFCDEQQGEDEQELGILVVGFSYYKSAFLRFCKLYFFYYWGVYVYGAQKCSLQSFKLPHLPSFCELVSSCESVSLSVSQWQGEAQAASGTVWKKIVHTSHCHLPMLSLQLFCQCRLYQLDQFCCEHKKSVCKQCCD